VATNNHTSSPRNLRQLTTPKGLQIIRSASVACDGDAHDSRLANDPKYVKLLRTLKALPDELRRGAVTIGNFDGVHRGHAHLVGQLIELAQEVDGPAVVMTFDPHPVRLLRPAEAPPPLTWTDRKAELLAEIGVDAVIAYPTDAAFLKLSAREFFDSIVCRQLNARAMVEGPNFFFGQGRQGTIATLEEFTSAAGMPLRVVEPVRIDGDYVSSSRVRRLVAAGQVEEAAQLLTRPYRIRGLVTHGSARGASIGFPTANVEAIDTLLPAEGVYAGLASTGTSRLAAAINIGPNPTFGEHTLKVEVHLIDFAGILYGQTLEVDFLQRLRDIQPFDGVEALVEQLGRDVQTSREAAEVALRGEPRDGEQHDKG